MRDIPRATDVVVIGGGPAGLAAAIAARRAGLEVIVVDRVSPPIDKACGEGLMPDGVAALRALGVELRPNRGRPFRGIRFLDGAVRPQAAFTHGYGLGIRRPELHHILLDRVHELGVTTLWGTAVDGLDALGVRIGDEFVRCRWIIGADGLQSRVRTWAGIAPCWTSVRRTGLRQRFRARPWTDFVEVYWRRGCQAYVTPVAADEVCVTTVAAGATARLSDLPLLFPSLAHRLAGAEPISPRRGAITLSARLPTVVCGRIALIGDASGSVDAVTGEGLSLAFRQAAALGAALSARDLDIYADAHCRLARRPRMMAHALLLMSDHDTLRRWALRSLAAWPAAFERLLALHVGDNTRSSPPTRLSTAPAIQPEAPRRAT